MKKNKSKFYLIVILFAHILVYILKIDRDVFAFQEYFRQPNQTYTEQLFPNTISYFVGSILNFFQSHVTCDIKNISIEQNAVWNSIILLYNSRIHHFLKHIETPITITQTIRIVRILHRKNIFHKSSKDDVFGYRFLI
jgi:hypothetical protein